LKLSIIKLILFGICLLPALHSFSQKKHSKYYRDVDGKTFTKRQFEDMIDEDFLHTYIVLKETKTADSLIVFFDKVAHVVPHEFSDNFSNKPLPPFSLIDMDGNTINSDSLSGKIVHINFWSAANFQSIAEFPQLNKLKGKYQKQDVIFIAISPENQAIVKQVLEKQPIHYLLIPDGGSYIRSLDITNFPKNFFVDRNGIVRKVTEGVPIHPVSEDILVFEQYDMIIRELASKK
jgi:peroxiredoxin